MKRTIKTLNAISKQGLSRLPETYTVANDATDPDAILVRSSDMHKLEIPESLLAVGRAGAGTNNIPVKAMSDQGVVVFNAPGANANAVKELVISGMLMGARNIFPALRFVSGLVGDDDSVVVTVSGAGSRLTVSVTPRGRSLSGIARGSISAGCCQSA